jgi:hypothetical protein
MTCQWPQCLLDRKCAPVARLASVVAIYLAVAILSGCVTKRAYSMRIELREEEKREISQFVSQLASRMECRFPVGDDAWRPAMRKFLYRWCHPTEPSNTDVVFEIQQVGLRFTATVYDIVQTGPVRPRVQAYAEEMHRVLGELVGNDRISVDRTNWPMSSSEVRPNKSLERTRGR